jgi:ribonuclease-3
MISVFQRSSRRRAKLEERLGYQFLDGGLLEEALTHASAVNNRRRPRRCNEQMEFLGDRVLGLTVASLIYERYGREAVGAMARRHSNLVRMETLAEIAGVLDLASEMRLSPGEDEGGGRRKPNLLADMCEAVIAAIYLDGGFEAANAFVRRFWEPLLDDIPETTKDAKTELQELVQGHSLELPTYTLVGSSGPEHALTFTVEVSVFGYEPVSGSGLSKRKAEQVAAGRMLSLLRNEPSLKSGDQ